MARASSVSRSRLWQQRLARFQASRQSVAEFCRQEGVSPPSFYLWRKRLSPRTVERTEPPAGFRPVRLVAAAEVAVQLPGGTQLSRADRRCRESAGGDRDRGPRRCRDRRRRPPMLSFAANIRIFLHARPTDMRKSFDGLCGLVRSVLQADPAGRQPVPLRQPPRRSPEGVVVGPRRPGVVLQAIGVGHVRDAAPERRRGRRGTRRRRTGHAPQRRVAGFGEASQTLRAGGLKPACGGISRRFRSRGFSRVSRHCEKPFFVFRKNSFKVLLRYPKNRYA